MGSLYLSNFNSPKKKWLVCDRHCIIVNKNLVNRTVPFENELVPLNGRIVTYGQNAEHMCQISRKLHWNFS